MRTRTKIRAHHRTPGPRATPGGAWARRRRRASTGLAILASAAVLLSYFATTLAYRADIAEPQPWQPARRADSSDTFRPIGTPRQPSCGGIEMQALDPPLQVDCLDVVLHRENWDLDHPLRQVRSADMLVENRFLRAGEKAYFNLLPAGARPSYRGCVDNRQAPQYWMTFATLQGRVICIRSDEGRVGILQAERALRQSPAVRARLTVWSKL